MHSLLVNRKYPIVLKVILILSILAVFLFPVAMGASPPGTIWYEPIHHDDNEYYGVSTFKVCADGGFILIGGYADFYGGSEDAGLLMKLYPTGELDWETKYGGLTMQFYDVDELADGSFIVVGAASYEYISSPKNMTLMKFNADGNLLWNMSYPVQAASYKIKAVADGFLIAGAPVYSTYGTGSEPFVIKVDTGGNYQWNKTAPLHMIGIYSLTFSPDGGYVMVGAYSGTEVVSKLDSNLNLTWEKFYGSTIGGLIAGGLPDGKVWMMYVPLGSSYVNTTMVMLDSGGNVLWNETTQWGTRPNILSPPQKTADGGFLIGGQFIVSPMTNVTGFIAKLDSTGHLAWIKLVDEPGPGFATPIFWSIPVSDGYVGVGGITNLTISRWGAYAIKLGSTEGTPTKQNVTLMLQSSKNSAIVSEVFNLTGSLSVLKSGPVTLLWSINGSGFNFSQNLTMTNGQFNRVFGANTPGTWAFKATWAGDSDYNGAESNVVTVSVITPTTITCSVTPSSITEGNTTTVSGSLSPALSGKTVTLTYTKPGGATLVRTATTSQSGAYSDLYQPDINGSWSVQASWAGDSTYSGATSAIIAFTVIEATTQPGSRCVIATATYGSEVAPQVQALRDFRETIALRTFAGSSFMSVFDSWYYSWSPPVAATIAPDYSLRAIMTVVLQPILFILQVATAMFTALSFNSEFGILMAGFVAAALIGLVYFAPITTLAFVGVKRLKRDIKLPSATKVFCFTAIPWAISIALIVIAELILAPLLMMIATSVFVILTIVVTVSTASLWLASFYRRC